MVQAAQTGAIDFSLARLQDPLWWRRLKFILLSLKEENKRDIFRARLHNAAAKSKIRWESLDVTKFWLADLNRQSNNILVSYYPELRQDEAEQKQAHQHRNQWVAQYGDPNDPAVKARIDATAEAILSRNVAARRRSRART